MAESAAMTRVLRWLAPLLAVLVLSSCSSTPERPDLARLYEAQVDDVRQPPVVLIHGLMGSTLVDKDGREYWPGGLYTLAFSDYAELARLDRAERAVGGLRAGDLFYGSPAPTITARWSTRSRTSAASAAPNPASR